MNIQFIHSYNCALKENLSLLKSKTTEVFKHFNISTIRKYIFDSIRETALESAGAAIGMYICEEYCASSLERESVKAGHLIGMISACGIAILAKKTTDSYLRTSQCSEKTKKIGGLVAGVGSGIISSTILPNYLGHIAGRIGRTVGAFMGAHGGIILGGYLGIKINGSQEHLINFEKTFDSYSVKILQGMALRHVLNYYLQPAPIILSEIRDFTCEAIGFNVVVVIIPSLWISFQGKLLNGHLMEAVQPFDFEVQNIFIHE